MSKPAAKAQPNGKKMSGATKSLTFSSIIMIIGLILSKGSGFLRDIFVVMKFDEMHREAFMAAFLIPDFIYALLIGGSIQSAITPTLSRSIENKTEKKAWKAISIFVSLMFVAVLIVTLLGEALSNVLYSIFYQNDSATVVHLAGNMARTLYPQVIFMMLAALCIGVLNAYKKFGSTAFGPVIYNIFVLMSIYIFGGCTEKNLYLTGLAITFSALVYFVFQLFMGRREISHFRPMINLKDQEFRKLFKLAVPILISASIVQLNMLLLKSFSTRFEGGPLFALRASETLWQLPYGIFAVGIGQVMLPSLSAHFAAKEYKNASDLLSRSIKNALFLAIPCSGIFFVLGEDVVRAVYKWNSSYTEENIKLAALFLMGYCISIITQSVIFILNQAFYAVGRTKYPLFAGIVTMVTNYILCYTFLELGMGPISLTIAYSISCVVRLVLLAVVYCRNKALAPKRMRLFIVKSVLCLLALMGALYFIQVVGNWHPDRKIIQLFWLAVRGMVGLLVYFVMAFLLRMEELKSAYERYLARFIKKFKKA